MLFAECTYTNRSVGIREYQKLIERSQLLCHDLPYYMLFSKSGFEEDLIELTKHSEQVELITLEAMIQDVEGLMQ